MACRLIDAQEMHRKHPATFWAPSKRQLANVKVGDHVKVACKGERFWVKVTQVKRGGWCGTVANDTEKLRFGSRICPKRKHIYNTMKG